MTSPSRKELVSERVAAGSRTYFFDVKQATDGTKYLVISESRQTGEQWEHDRVMVFDEHLGAFIEAFEKVAEVLRARKKTYSVDAIRKNHPRAYKAWSSDDDKRLKSRYAEGFTIPELATVFQRKEGAIRSRLQKLGVLLSPSE